MPGRAACLGLMSRAGQGGLGSAAQAQGPGRVGREEMKAGTGDSAPNLRHTRHLCKPSCDRIL